MSDHVIPFSFIEGGKLALEMESYCKTGSWFPEEFCFQ